MKECQIATIFLIVFIIWTFTLQYRIFQNSIKKYVVNIGVLLVFWIIVRIVKSVINEDITNLLWYLYYLPMIFIPTLYYLCSKKILENQKKSAYVIPIVVSSILFLLVLTNDLHRLVFSALDESYNYERRLGYFLICVWIFYQLIESTIVLGVRKMSKDKDWRFSIVFLPIIVGLVYTILYVKNVSFIVKIDFSLVLIFLFFIGIESLLQFKLIPNNTRYKKPFIKSNLNMAIISNRGNVVLETLNKITVPDYIIDDILNKKVKKKYNNDYEILEISNGYAITMRNNEGIKKLRNEINKKNNELIKQQELLKNEQSIREKIYELELKKEINSELENNIREKKQEIESLLDLSENIDKDENISITSKKMADLYGTVFEILRKINGCGVYIIIKEAEGSIRIKFMLDIEIDKISFNKNMKVKYSITEDGTNLEVVI